MPNDVRKNAQAWIAKAEEDEKSIYAVLKEGAPSTACFLAQQMAEKYLKGLIVFFGKDFPKVHDLLELESILLSFVSDISFVHKELNELSSYYIETRYPGDYQIFTNRDAEQAYQAALRVKEFVLGKMSK